jgi:hypothetical protein
MYNSGFVNLLILEITVVNMCQTSISV